MPQHPFFDRSFSRSSKARNAEQTIPFVQKSLEKNLQWIQDEFHTMPDLQIKRFITNQGINAAVIYFEEISDKMMIFNDIINQLVQQGSSVQQIQSSTVIANKGENTSSLIDVEQAVLKGKSTLFIEGLSSAYVFDTADFPIRNIEEPNVERTIKGSHDGFVESHGKNIALLRKYLPSRQLKIKQMKVGKRGEIKVSLMYLEDVTRPEILQELERRISQIDIDVIINIGELQQLISDNKFTVLPQFLETERPGTAAMEILDGRVAIIMDRSPSVLIAPIHFIGFLKTKDDYNINWIIASFVRFLRYISLAVGILLPAFYIATISMHFEVIPLKLLLSIGESRERVPFPPLLEALLMEFALEMLREAGLRLPTSIGQTVSIVGGIVIGQAAVQAGVVSNIMVIVVSLTAICSFIIPYYDMSAAVRIIRFPMMLLAYLFGYVGISVGIMFLLIHIISMNSIGVPYGLPVTPIRLYDWKDAFFKLPQRFLTTRPDSARPIQKRKSQLSKRGR
ncbi:spore germination protein [Brevibacillus daliensis]|uniref:spore germination protein n=1 Tax=Brevibacillus daliensis TaxID=2892995 RepID=UPI001E395486|nr:spore germination protein [Brevibacillus daliensis]